MAKHIIPDDLLYTTTHEWVKVEDGVATVGITDFAQDKLGDIVFIELSVEENDSVKQEETIGSLDSTKAVSDIYAPLSGTVTETNTALLDSPEVLNEDPYDEGWLLRIEMSDPDELEKLMDPEAYAEFCEQED